MTPLERGLTFAREIVLGAFLCVSAASGASLPDCADPDILKALGCLSGVTAVEVTPVPAAAGYRQFEITIDQPDDHFNPASGRFKQRLVLLHKSKDEPMVLQTSGYKIFKVAVSELAKNFGANQIQVEHRFFDQSTPNSSDWRLLDIRQSAFDFHRITQKFRKIYGKRWVGTGGSKGGMTTLFHRWFFPGDLDGTVADVAPLSFSIDDPRYVGFVEQVGGAKYEECREKLAMLQVALLRRRQEVMPHLKGLFVYLGGKSVAYEHAVIELSFAFWQYQNPADEKLGCGKIPATDAPATELAKYLGAVNELDSYADGTLLSLMPYYYQAATQLGTPGATTAHLNQYRLHPYSVHQYTPHRAKYHYSNSAMRAAEKWAATKAEGVMFVYGEFDPWTAAAYPKTSSASDFHWFMVPGGNHSAKIFKLPKAEKEKALAVVSRWMDKRPEPQTTYDDQPSLDEIELRMRRSARLP